MARLHRPDRRLDLKIAYVGPAGSGKTTHLARLSGRACDAFRQDLPPSGGLRVRIEVVAARAADRSARALRAALSGVDGIVFVADAAAERLDENVLALECLADHLGALGRTLADVPHVVQYNRSDRGDAVPPALGLRLCNPHGAPSRVAAAARGIGVWETHRDVVAHVAARFDARLALAEAPELAVG